MQQLLKKIQQALSKMQQLLEKIQQAPSKMQQPQSLCFSTAFLLTVSSLYDSKLSQAPNKPSTALNKLGKAPSKP